MPSEQSRLFRSTRWFVVGSSTKAGIADGALICIAPPGVTINIAIPRITSLAFIDISLFCLSILPPRQKHTPNRYFLILSVAPPAVWNSVLMHTLQVLLTISDAGHIANMRHFTADKKLPYKKTGAIIAPVFYCQWHVLLLHTQLNSAVISTACCCIIRCYWLLFAKALCHKVRYFHSF